jgi:hypothetical protein
MVITDWKWVWQGLVTIWLADLLVFIGTAVVLGILKKRASPWFQPIFYGLIGSTCLMITLLSLGWLGRGMAITAWPHSVGPITFAVIMAVAFLSFGARLRSARQIVPPVSETQAVGIATMTTGAEVKFDADAYLARAYKTEMLGEIENDIRTAISRHQVPKDRENVCLKLASTLLAVGMYEDVWFSSFGSQIRLLQDLNRRALNIDQVRNFYHTHFYATAKTKYPGEYTDFTFDRWLGVLSRYGLVVRHSDMVRLTKRGNDFLKYLVHCRRTADDRRL